MLLDPTAPRPDSAVPALPTPETTPDLPADVAALVSRGRRERGSALALVYLLLERGWTPQAVATALADRVGLTRTRIESLATVHRPRTSASEVAERLVATRRPLARVPHPRRR